MFLFLRNVFNGNVPSVFLRKRPNVSNFSLLFSHYRERFLNHTQAVTLRIKCSPGVSLQRTSQECELTGGSDHKPANPNPPRKTIP